MDKKYKDKLDDIIYEFKKPFIFVEDCYNTTIRFFKNVWFYRKIMANDRWYDYSYLLSIMERKLEQMAINWKYSIYVGREEERRTIVKALWLLRKLNEDNFIAEAMNPMNKKYGNLELNLDDSDNSPLFLRNGKEETSEQYEDWKKYHQIAYDNKEKCKTEFFELMRLNYEKWWD